jgi:hypothetical protein
LNETAKTLADLNNVVLRPSAKHETTELAVTARHDTEEIPIKFAGNLNVLQTLNVPSTWRARMRNVWILAHVQLMQTALLEATTPAACVMKATRAILTAQDASQFPNPQDPNVQRIVSVPANLLVSMRFARTPVLH